MMSMRCELCKGKARMHCESDQASLCWDCDAMVHSANFLVARHTRNLLCRVCHSPTPWSASGAKIRPIFFVCEQCVDRKTERCEEDEQVVEQEEVVEENHLVPPPPPPAEDSCSSSGEEDVVVSRKRLRLDNVFSSPDLNLPSEEDVSCNSVEEGADSLLSRSNTTPLRKVQRFDLNFCEAC